MLKLQDFTPEKLRIDNDKRKLHHIFSQADCDALWAAWAAGRPLLVRGKPGTGKSQMARAIAERLGWGFTSEVIRGDTELSDLHWHFDAVARLGEAQAQSVEGADKADLDPANFLSPGAFWWAFNWKTAEKQYLRCKTKMRPEPVKPDDSSPRASHWNSETGGVVVLIDEIDKADPDLPNGLLETLGNLEFTVPYLNHQQNKDAALKNPIKADAKKLLVIITTNEERELPQAFVRRCFVHTLKMEEGEEVVDTISLTVNDKKEEIDISKREQWLIDRGKLHFSGDISDQAYVLAAQLLWKDRDAGAYDRYPPGLAEYIDLLTAIKQVENKSQQAERLQAIADFALDKELKE